MSINAIIKGFQQRLHNKKLKDNMTLELLERCIDNYNNTIMMEKQINTHLSKKKIRQSNFPSHISENIAKFAICKRYGIMPTWDTEKGDLFINSQLEVKGSIDLHNGPPTFGPTEVWSHIFFVDGVDTQLKKYKVYHFPLSNDSDKWRNLKVNKTETYHDQCIQKRRPRLSFKQIQSQLPNECTLIFDGHISQLV